MELKQLEFFVTAYETGSLSKAAVSLYTTQPNVSRVIKSLEAELGSLLFERSPEGLKVTPYGRSIYRYAKDMLKYSDMIRSTNTRNRSEFLSISTYQSHWLSGHITRLYNRHPDIFIEHRNGTVEEIVSHVSEGQSELGILYVSQKQFAPFRNIISAGKLTFTALGTRNACLYAGPHSPLYERTSVDYDELTSLRFVRGTGDFFSLEDELGGISTGLIRPDTLDTGICSNSEHISTDCLLYTDLVTLGIAIEPFENSYQEQIRKLPINGEDTRLVIGYITRQNQILSPNARELIDEIKTELSDRE